MRERVFGTSNSLTKTPLIFSDRRLKPFVEWHHVKDAHIADISCILLHYPFTSTFREKVEEAAQTKRYASALWEYAGYWELLERNPNVVLASGAARRFRGLDELIKDEFLIVSEKYLQWVKAHTNKNATFDEKELGRDGPQT